ncbi:MAG: deoxynucleoside kinase [Candidatus Falkowbacteria bacterium]
MKKENQPTTYPGKLIVIDGIDGSGKATQTKFLAERLKRAGLTVETIAFPRHGNKSAGFVSEYLSGKYGGANEVDSYQASLFYALNRYDASFQIREWLNQGRIVIADRYVTANMGHQGGKITNPLERKLFFDWLYRLEYEILNIPKPDLNIFLQLNSDIARRLIDGRNMINQDIHEKDSDHLKHTEEAFMQITKDYPDFILIECASDGQMLEREQISDLIWRQIINKLIILPRTTEIVAKRKMLIKRILPTAFMPTRADHTRPLFNLYSAVGARIATHQTANISTGLKIHLPKNYSGLILDYPDNLKNNLIASKNRIYSELSSEIIISLTNLSRESITIAAGQKIAQMLIIG